jgi:aminopeptidase N
VVIDPRAWVLKTLDFDKPVAEWVIQLDSSKSLPPRLETVRALGNLGGDEAVVALGRVLREDPFYGLRREAAKALGKIGKDAALEALRPGLADKDTRVRSSAVDALGSFPDHPELIRTLKRILETDGNDFVRAAAANALGNFERREDIAPPLLAALSVDSFHELVRGAALRALAKVDPARAWEPAKRLAKYGAPIDSRSEALDALVTIAKKDAQRRDEARKLLEGYLDDPSYNQREGAYRALAKLGDPAALPAVERRGRLETEGRQRRNAERAAEAIRDAQMANREDQALRERVEQLERETEVLKEQIRQGKAGEKKEGGAGG